MPNPVVHFEIGVNDMEKGIQFYQKLFDWKIESPPGMGYGLINTGDTLGGGMFQADEKWKPGVSVYFSVEDIEATLKIVEEKGGKILQEKKLIGGDYGYTGVFADPDGTIVGLWSKSESQE